MVVFDTTFLIDLAGSLPEAVRLFEDLLRRGKPLRVPTVALMEFAGGTRNIEHSVQKVRESFVVEPFDEGLAVEAAGIGRDLLTRGEFPGWTDVAIAATATHFDEELVSRNARDFRAVKGLRLLLY